MDVGNANIMWGKHRHVMAKEYNGWWQSLKIGGGSALYPKWGGCIYWNYVTYYDIMYGWFTLKL